MTKYIDEKGQSIIRNIVLKTCRATVAKANLCHELLAPEFKDVLAREMANERKDYTKTFRFLMHIGFGMAECKSASKDCN